MTQIIHPWVREAERTIRFGIAWGAQDPSSSWAETQDFVQMVEELGFDSFWAIDHPSAPVSGADCWTTLAVLRSHTTMPLFLAETESALQEKLAAVPADTRERFAPSTVAGTPDDVIPYFRSLVAAGMKYFITLIYPKDVEAPC